MNSTTEPIRLFRDIQIGGWNPYSELSFHVLRDAYIKASRDLEAEKSDNKELLEVIRLQDEYIIFLGGVIGDYAGLSISHPWLASSPEVIQQGIKHRESISKAKQLIEKYKV